MNSNFLSSKVLPKKLTLDNFLGKKMLKNALTTKSKIFFLKLGEKMQKFTSCDWNEMHCAK
jgi:hypothetical protein